MGMQHIYTELSLSRQRTVTFCNAWNSKIITRFGITTKNYTQKIMTLFEMLFCTNFCQKRDKQNTASLCMQSLSSVFVGLNSSDLTPIEFISNPKWVILSSWVYVFKSVFLHLWGFVEYSVLTSAWSHLTRFNLIRWRISLLDSPSHIAQHTQLLARALLKCWCVYCTNICDDITSQHQRGRKNLVW